MGRGLEASFKNGTKGRDCSPSLDLTLSTETTRKAGFPADRKGETFY